MIPRAASLDTRLRDMQFNLNGLSARIHRVTKPAKDPVLRDQNFADAIHDMEACISSLYKRSKNPKG
jgi:hypothetical protein|eukprot:SAG25_NODE_2227_length_1821_cov_1.117886_1_plen_67_part_00